MIDRRLMLKGFFVAASFAVSPSAFAFEAQTFDAKAFEAAQMAGKPVLIEVTAPWCPTCKAQKPILSNLGKDPKFKDMVVFQIDFDTQKDLLRKFDVRMQSTLISYKGTKEVGRSTGDTNAASIEALLVKSI
jgi:thiol-disulfide isomerase/thioredoxin